MSVAYWQDSSAAEPVCEVDILIVGAGIAGWSVAYWLREEGLSVAVLDRGDRCAGATGRNAGFATCGSVEHYARQVSKHGPALARELWALSEDNLRLIQSELVDRGVQCDFARRGTYSLAGSEHELGELEQSTALMRSEGIHVSMVDARHVAEHLGARGFTGGALYHDDGELHPVKLVAGMAELSGADFHPFHEVHRIEQGADGVDVYTQRRRFRAQAVVLATNGYSYLLDPWFADRIYPTRGQIVVTEPVAPFLAAPCYANFVLDYFRQLPDGRVLIGGFRQLAKDTEVGSADEPNPVIQAALEAFLEEHFEALRGKRIEYRWAGIMGFSADGMPLIGSLPHKPSVYFVGGFTAHGIGFAFKAGQLTARLIAHGETPGPLSARRLR